MTDAQVPTPDNNTDSDTIDWAAAWNGMVQTQQRWWTEWVEGSQLWASWWLSQMPPITAVTASSWPVPPVLVLPEQGPPPQRLVGEQHASPTPRQLTPQRVTPTSRHH